MRKLTKKDKLLQTDERIRTEPTAKDYLIAGKIK